MWPMADGDLAAWVSPIDGLKQWLRESTERGLPEPTAMTLATVGQDGRPHARIVLLKGIGPFPGEGSGPDLLQFYTNLESRKSQDLTSHPFAALVFHWVVARRQVRIEGRVRRISPEQAQAYYESRPRGSQVGAWASPQSQVIGSRDDLKRRLAQTEELFRGAATLKCPPHWGGWALDPDRMEFWEERPFRLHERLEYLRSGESWTVRRLAP
jgi:pyridoxamine 5'-phosphate oxidase